MIELIFGILMLLLLVYCLICMLSAKKYEAGLERVSEKDFPLKKFMPIGLTTQRLLMQITHNNRLFIGGKDVRRKLSVIYGEHQLKFYMMVYSADALTYIVVFLAVGCMLVPVRVKFCSQSPGVTPAPSCCMARRVLMQSSLQR